MKILISLVRGGVIAVALSLPAHAAGLSNPSFEAGDLSSWSFTTGQVEVLTDADDAIVTPPFGEHFTAKEGQYFAQLTAGSEEGTYTILSQAFSLASASLVSFDAAFLAFDYLDYNDDAYVKIYSLSGALELFAYSVADVGDQGHTTWLHRVSGPLAIGDYVLEAGVRNVGDPDPFYSSRLLLDNLSLSAAPVDPTVVPEPAVWALLIAGFAAVGAMARAQRRRTAHL